MPKGKVYDKIHTIVDPELNDDKLEKLAVYCRNNMKRFTDKQFPPNQQSLVGNPTPSDYDGSFSKFGYARPEVVFNGNDYDLFRKIEPSDILQGGLGDCYFLVCLSGLAEYPPLIGRLFEFDEKNPYGFYPIWLHINGSWRRYIIDDYLPVNRGSNSLAFSRTEENEMWVTLIEKAYAKAYGGYWNIVGGDPVHALRDLTGAPYDRISDFSNPDVVWNKLKKANDQQYMMTCFTKNTQITEEKHDTGIVSGHAYSILDVRKYTDVHGNEQKLIQIRNPWGKFEWNGDFSDRSPLWRPEDKHLYIEEEDDGLFWMRVEDFVRHYQGVGLLAIKPDYRSNAIKLKQTSQANKSVARLIVDESSVGPNGYCETFISVDQADSRTVQEDGYQYSYIRLTIGRIDKEDEEIEFVDTMLSPERSIFSCKKLSPGEYIILVEVYWDQKHHNEITVGSYSEGPVILEKLKSNDTLYNMSEYMIWKSFANQKRDQLSKINPNYIYDDGVNVTVEANKYKNQNYAMVLYDYLNTSGNKTAHQVVSIKNHKGFDICSAVFQDGSCDLIMNPKENDVILFKMDPRSEGFSLSHAVTEEELLNSNFSKPYKSAFEMLNELGSVSANPNLDKAGIDLGPALGNLVDDRRKKNEESAMKSKAEKIRQMKEAEKRRKEQIEQQRQKQYMKQQKGRYDPMNLINGFKGGLGGISSHFQKLGMAQNLLNMMGGGGNKGKFSNFSGLISQFGGGGNRGGGLGGFGGLMGGGNRGGGLGGLGQMMGSNNIYSKVDTQGNYGGYAFNLLGGSNKKNQSNYN